ncbi:MAG: hypothetical protein CM15mP77_1120 [Synechococcus sp.]|nr:MAG: hypothetical protein CM15mP77_1120 [Synechococcus sp.]
MRLPGGLHPERKERTTIRSISGHVYKLAALEAVLPPEEEHRRHYHDLKNPTAVNRVRVGCSVSLARMTWVGSIRAHAMSNTAWRWRCSTSSPT